MKKPWLTCIAAILLLLPVPLQLTNAATHSLGEQLDQQQTEINMEGRIYGSNWLAQSFKPSLDILTTIKLCLSRRGDVQSNLTVSIRNSLTGEDITAVSLNSSSIPTEQTWVDIDIANITVTVEKTYYIVCRTIGGDKNNCFTWYGGTNTSYDRGVAYTSNTNGSTWQQQIFNDYAFKTYGLGKGRLEFTYIYGAFGGEIKFGIKNTGMQNVSDITVNMNIKGLVLIGRKYQHTFKTTLQPNQELSSVIHPIIGLGPAEITITVWSPDTPKGVTEKREAFLLPFYVYIGPQ